MSAVTPRDIVLAAQAGGYAVGAFNMHNPETTQALIQAAQRAEAPVFLQIGRAIVPHLGLAEAYRMVRHELDRSGLQAPIHLDHGTYDEVFEAIRLGFDSIMFDGSHMPFKENIEATKHVVTVAHSFGIPVEAELGSIPDADNAIDWEAHYTKVDEAERFVAETGVDFLAISAGVMHGVPSLAPQPLAIELIERIRDVTNVPLVLHGASGVPTEELHQAIAAGVHKLNADTDLRHAFRRGLEQVFAEGDRQLETAMAEGRRHMIEATIAKMQEYGAAGKASASAPALVSA